MRKPYLKLYKKIDDVDVYIVDGDWIRSNRSDQFTNFACHARFPFIPKDEFWLDKDYGYKEYEFYITNLMAIRNALKQGKSFEKAREIGCKTEEEAREERPIPDRPIKIKELDSYANISTYLVDGELVRDLYDIDFTGGGHDLVYDWIKPEEGKGEIWISDELSAKERSKYQIHEMRERNKMAMGEKYFTGHGGAHISASIEEIRARKYPQDTNALLEKEREIATIIALEGKQKKGEKDVVRLERCWKVCNPPNFMSKIHPRKSKSHSDIPTIQTQR